MMVKLHTWLKMPPPNEDMADLGEVVKVKFSLVTLIMILSLDKLKRYF